MRRLKRLPQKDVYQRQAPFHLIKIEHYEPALLEGMKEQNEEIDAIVNNPEAPTFQNTIVALENSGALLDLSLIHI